MYLNHIRIHFRSKFFLSIRYKNSFGRSYFQCLLQRYKHCLGENTGGGGYRGGGGYGGGGAGYGGGGNFGGRGGGFRGRGGGFSGRGAKKADLGVFGAAPKRKQSGGNDGEKKQRTCGLCRKPGHTRHLRQTALHQCKW